MWQYTYQGKPYRYYQSESLYNKYQSYCQKVRGSLQCPHSYSKDNVADRGNGMAVCISQFDGGVLLVVWPGCDLHILHDRPCNCAGVVMSINNVWLIMSVEPCNIRCILS